MTDITPLIVVVALAGPPLGFMLGYRSADTRERKAKWAAQRQVTEIGRWVRGNWPDRYAAHEEGYKRGYEQGFNDGETLGKNPDA